MRLLVDADIIARRAACAADSKSGGDQGQDKANYNARSMMVDMFQTMNTTDHIGYLGTRGDRSQHRYKIFPEYKANRKNIEYPKYLDGVRSYLQSEFDIEVVEGIEADDALSIEQHNNLIFSETVEPSLRTQREYKERVVDSETCICSIDKDLMIVPGWHYDFVKKETVFQTELEGLRCFYKQIITGDASDGIPRVYPKVVVTSWTKKIDKAESEKEMLDIVRDCYYNVIYGGDSAIITRSITDSQLWIELNEEILWRGQLLMPLKQLNQLWEIPNV